MGGSDETLWSEPLDLSLHSWSDVEGDRLLVRARGNLMLAKAQIEAGQKEEDRFARRAATDALEVYEQMRYEPRSFDEFPREGDKLWPAKALPHRLVGDKVYSRHRTRECIRRYRIRSTILRESNDHRTWLFDRANYPRAQD
jgi:hypothetical protein